MSRFAAKGFILSFEALLCLLILLIALSFVCIPDQYYFSDLVFFQKSNDLARIWVYESNYSMLSMQADLRKNFPDSNVFVCFSESCIPKNEDTLVAKYLGYSSNLFEFYVVYAG